MTSPKTAPTLKSANPALIAIAVATLLSACSGAPKVPVADESTRRPANNPSAIELHACRTELHNTRLLASESTRLAETTTAAMHQLVLTQGAKACTAIQTSTSSGRTATTATTPATASTVYTFLFDNNTTQLALPEDSTRALLDDARSAALIVVRGRTDASSDAPMNAKAARERAEAARDLLTAAGIDTKRIRLTWQAFGDHVADNTTADGKALNRRVELELYRTAPTLVAAPKRAPVPATTTTAAATQAP